MKIKGWAELAKNGEIKVFANLFAPYCIFPSKEQPAALERQFPTEAKIVEVTILLPSPKKEIDGKEYKAQII